MMTVAIENRARRVLVALSDASLAFAPRPRRAEGGFWRRLLIALSDSTPAFTAWGSLAKSASGPLNSRVPWSPGLEHPVVRLPRFDRAVLRTAGTASVRGHRLEVVSSGVQFIQRDAGRGRLEILAESASDEARSAVLPVTVVTPERTAGYLLIFRAEDPGRWVADIHVPDVWDRADVFVHAMRERASLGSDDSEVVARSVRAVPDSWVPEWQAVARERAEGDPVREAIEGALGA
jgi:hypothetical protein